MKDVNINSIKIYKNQFPFYEFYHKEQIVFFIFIIKWETTIFYRQDLFESFNYIFAIKKHNFGVK